MGLANIKRHCLEGGQEEQKTDHIHILANDFRYFQKQRWYSFHNPLLFDTNKFIFLYPNYEQEQSQLLTKWNSVIDIKGIDYGEFKNDEEVLSTRWKYAIRRGVPLEYYKIIVGAIFKKPLNSSSQVYDKLKNELNLNEPAPLFGHEQVSLSHAVFAPFLNDRGWAALKDLLHAFRKKKAEPFYNKYIGHLTAVFLIFFSESQTYELMSTLIEDSSNLSLSRLESLRWHIVFKQEQMKNNLALAFYKIVSTTSPTLASIVKYLDKNSIDKEKLFYALTDNFFYSFLPFPLILRIFIIFLNEGVRIMFRICYVILAYCEKEIKAANSLKRVCLIIQKKCLCLSHIQMICMLKKSFNLNLKAVISPRLVESRLKKEQSQKKCYFLPNIEGVSNILSYHDLQLLWSFLPFQLKSYDLKLRYPLETTNLQKMKLKDLLKSLQAHPFCLIIIKTLANHQNNVFGCFIADKVHSEQSENWYGSNQNFVFTLHPEQKKYPCTRQNNHYLKTTKKCLYVGFGETGSAIVLHDDLLKGESYKCGTFSNQALSSKREGEFEIDWIQAFTLF